MQPSLRWNRRPLEFLNLPPKRVFTWQTDAIAA